MTTHADDWREQIDPPAGGLARLHAAIEARRSRRARPWALRAALAAACLALALGVTELPPYLRRERLRTALAAALAPPAAVSVERGAAFELPSRRADVRIVFVAALEPNAPANLTSKP